jgi:subtilisin family serine protease
MPEVVYKSPTPIFVSQDHYNDTLECWKNNVLRAKKIQEDFSDGKGAVLAILDDGVGLNVELMKNKISRTTYYDKAKKFGNHSTHIASIIAGITYGIFPNIEIKSKQVINPDTGIGRSAEIVSAIYTCLNSGIQTINLSLGSDSPDKHIERALRDFCSNGQNIATIAAGNDGEKTDYPAYYAKKIKGVLSIAATEIDEDGNITVTAFSSRGYTSISAPGVNLKAMGINDRKKLVSGTSFSAPIVGAAIAVARSLRSGITQDEILYLLQKTATKMNEKPEIAGYGHIDIYNFLKAVKKLDVIHVPAQQKTTWEKLIDIMGF